MNKIPYEERCEVYASALVKWGEAAQITVAIEEMSEVIKALTKFFRKPSPIKNVLPSIIEEVADATIMLEQLRLIFGINDEVCEAMDAKIERLKERVSGN